MKRARRLPVSLRRQAKKPRMNLAAFLMTIPEGDPIDREWDEMPAVGREIEPAPVTLRSILAMRRFLRGVKRRRQRKRLGGGRGRRGGMR